MRAFFLYRKEIKRFMPIERSIEKTCRGQLQRVYVLYSGSLWSIGARPKWQTEAHEKVSKRLHKGGLQNAQTVV